MFSWSYQQLSPTAARMFRFLGLHPGPDITVAAAASLTGTALPDAGRALRELTAANLLTEHAARPVRLPRPAPRLRRRAGRGGRRRGSPRSGHHRMLDHYLHTAHAAALLLKPWREPVAFAPKRPGVTPEQVLGHQAAMAWFEAEHRVLIGATALAVQAGFDSCAGQLPSVMADFLERRGHWRELRRHPAHRASRRHPPRRHRRQAMAGRELGPGLRLARPTMTRPARHMTESLELYRVAR